MKKIFLILLLGMFLVSLASAADWDNSLRYEKDDMKVTIENWGWVPLFGSDLGSVELKSHKTVNQVLEVAIGKDRVVMYYDFNFKEIYEDGLGEVDFINMTDGKEINKDYHFVIWETIIKDVDDYFENCEQVYIAKNNSYYDSCTKVISGTHKEEVEGWVKFTGKDIPKGIVRIGLATDVNIGDRIDGIWTIAGKKISKHSEWTASLNIGLTRYYKEDDNLATTNVIDSTNTDNGTLGGGDNTQDLSVPGKIETALDFNGVDDRVVFTKTTFNDLTFNWWGTLGFNKGHVFVDSTEASANTNRIVWDVSTLNIQTATAFGSISETPTVDSTFRMYTLTRSGNTWELFIDNVTAGTASIAGSIDIDSFASKPAYGTSLPFYNGTIDEVGIWNRTLSNVEISQLYNSGTGISYTDYFPEISVTLNSPVDNFATQNKTIIFNASIDVDFSEIINVSLLINGEINETNVSGNEGVYTFQKDLSIGSYNWSIRATDNESNIVNSSTRDLFILNSTDPQLWTDEYQVRIIAFDLTESDFEINNVVVTEESDNVWKVNTTESDYEVARAQVIKTFFYGTDGSDARINRTTGISKIQTIDTDDVRKRGIYVSNSFSGTGAFSNTGTFSNTLTNNNCSSWSKLTASSGTGNGIRWELPSGTILHSVGESGSSNEIGTDTSADEDDNPANSQIERIGGNANTGSAEVIIFCNGSMSWSGTMTEDANVDFTVNESIPEFSPVPNITLNSPEDNSQELQNAELNFNITSTITGSILDEAKLFINGTLNETISISGTENTTIFTKSFPELGNYNWSVEVCDINDNCALSETRDFEINNLVEINQTFQNTSIEGNLQNISASVQLGTGITISAVVLDYDGSLSAGTSSTSGEDTTILRSGLVTPAVDADENITFHWIIVLSGGETVNLTDNNQTILNLDIDNCSSFTNVLFNITMVDEEKQTILSNTTLEISLNVLSSDRSVTVISFSQEFNDTNPAAICLDQEISVGTRYLLDSIMRYTARGYANEYYNIVDLELTNETGTTNLTLYSLNESDSTEFQFTFKGSDFLPEEDALVFVERQYISEDDFKTVELPKTDSNGQTVLHMVRNSVLYNIRVVKDDEVLRVFNNVIAFCQDFTIGECTISLNAVSNESGVFNYDESVGIIYSRQPSYNQTTRVVSFAFTSSDGSTRNVFMEVQRSDIFGNRSVCNNTVVSPSGILSCTIGEDIDDTTLITSVSVGDNPWLSFSTIIDDTAYGSAGYVVWFLITLVSILMFSDSKNGVMISIMISYVGAIGLGVGIGGIVGIGSSGVWIMLITSVGIWQINKNRVT